MAGDPIVINAQRDGLYRKGRTSGLTISELQTITANYTLTEADSATVMLVDSATPVTITLPSTMPAGFSLAVVQVGAGQVTFTAASGATLVNHQTFTKTAAQNAIVSLIVISNSSDANAKYLLTGDGAV